MRIGDYFVESIIGTGGMGVVCRAKQISMKRSVALKILKSELSSDTVYMERFYSEVRLLAQMSHPNIVQVIEGGYDNGTAFFSMEYAEGHDLKQLLDSGRHFSVNEVLMTCRKIAGALEYAWDKFKMIHRDVKPANIMLLTDGTVKLFDLGISKLMDPAVNPDPVKTSQGVLVGSPTYMSPEQAQNNVDIDFRADIYSLGVTMYQLLAGHPPYESKNPLEVVSMHFNAEIPDIRKIRHDVPRDVANLIRRMLAKTPTDRFDSWESLINAMRTAIAGKRAKRIHRAGANSSSGDNQIPLRQSVVYFCAIGALLFAGLAVYLAAVFFDGDAHHDYNGQDELEHDIYEIPSNQPATQPLTTLVPDKAPLVPSTGNVSGQEMSDSTTIIAENLTSQAISEVSEGEGKNSLVPDRDRDVIYRERRDELIEHLEKRSREFEARGEYIEALKMWTEDLKLPDEFSEDEVLRSRIEFSIRYLQRRLSKIEAGLGR